MTALMDVGLAETDTEPDDISDALKTNNNNNN